MTGIFMSRDRVTAVLVEGGWGEGPLLSGRQRWMMYNQQVTQYYTTKYSVESASHCVTIEGRGIFRQQCKK
ncbi:hypothetical protein E2C01_073859 [Portunus trituberculatus]|uniref:Uncharacterized protein n=1 Tax=Portunus trituberculatus TaxID=210409 RepID=A0A5B7IBP7_PORTR|nr:hypothetical protein [Portunus trituberculatus]